MIMRLSDKLKQDQIPTDPSHRIDELIHQAKMMEELLIESAELFRFYEDSHRKRGPEHLEKAERNAEIAGRIERALGA